MQKPPRLLPPNVVGAFSVCKPRSLLVFRVKRRRRKRRDGNKIARCQLHREISLPPHTHTSQIPSFLFLHKSRIVVAKVVQKEQGRSPKTRGFLFGCLSVVQISDYKTWCKLIFLPGSWLEIWSVSRLKKKTQNSREGAGCVSVCMNVCIGVQAK